MNALRRIDRCTGALLPINETASRDLLALRNDVEQAMAAMAEVVRLYGKRGGENDNLLPAEQQPDAEVRDLMLALAKLRGAA